MAQFFSQVRLQERPLKDRGLETYESPALRRVEEIEALLQVIWADPKNQGDAQQLASQLLAFADRPTALDRMLKQLHGSTEQFLLLSKALAEGSLQGGRDRPSLEVLRDRIDALWARDADIDVTVIALIGERGREVREFVERELGPEGMKRAVVVCSTSERAPMERLKAGFVATAIAEYFRDQGMRVLLLMDSLTRLARAQRELGLMAGEPPTRRGFPPSVFAMLPRLLERAGMNDRGSITAFYTVLVEGDDMNEPVADESRSILDGHIVLSRKLAAAGHYPAVDVLASVSRVMNAVVDAGHRQDAQAVRALMAKHDEVELLVRLGEYKRGSDAMADKAIDRIADIRAFLCQRPSERTSAADMLNQLKAVAV